MFGPNWPNSGEIDIIEGKSFRNLVNGLLCYATESSCFEPAALPHTHSLTSKY